MTHTTRHLLSVTSSSSRRIVHTKASKPDGGKLYCLKKTVYALVLHVFKMLTLQALTGLLHTHHCIENVI